MSLICYSSSWYISSIPSLSFNLVMSYLGIFLLPLFLAGIGLLFILLRWRLSESTSDPFDGLENVTWSIWNSPQIELGNLHVFYSLVNVKNLFDICQRSKALHNSVRLSPFLYAMYSPTISMKFLSSPTFVLKSSISNLMFLSGIFEVYSYNFS